jgi:integrase
MIRRVVFAAGARWRQGEALLVPGEFLACRVVRGIPVEWRELHAVAVFTYARLGEL